MDKTSINVLINGENEMKELRINSQEELKKLFDEYRPKFELNESSYSKTRYVDDQTYCDLFLYLLDFEPYIEMAKNCSMIGISLKRSEKTNIFYIGFFNDGGHRSISELRPVRLKEVLDLEYMKSMFENYCQKSTGVLI